MPPRCGCFLVVFTAAACAPAGCTLLNPLGGFSDGTVTEGGRDDQASPLGNDAGDAGQDARVLGDAASSRYASAVLADQPILTTASERR